MYVNSMQRIDFKYTKENILGETDCFQKPSQYFVTLLMRGTDQQFFFILNDF